MYSDPYLDRFYLDKLWFFFPLETPEKVNPEEDSETLDGCEADSLDSAIDPEEHTAKHIDDDDDEYIDSIVHKGKRIKKGSGLRSHHFSSVGNLLQVCANF